MNPLIYTWAWFLIGLGGEHVLRDLPFDSEEDCKAMIELIAEQNSGLLHSESYVCLQLPVERKELGSG